MRIVLLTNEYPPYIYGGAGIHVEYLSRELTRLEGGRHEIQILCFGDQRIQSANEKVEGIGQAPDFPQEGSPHRKLMDTLFRNIRMTGAVKDPDIVHCHTWYTHLAGCLIKQIWEIPSVITTHSLEPQRPWKEEQLGAAYKASTWLEKTAYQNADGVIAVSQSMRNAVHNLYQVSREKIRVIPNGIDVEQYKPTPNPVLLRAYGLNPDKPFLLFVGRISRQKGIIHLVNAIPHLIQGVQVVLCGGAPDTDAMAREMEQGIEKVRSQTQHEIVWIPRWVPRDHMVTLYTHASLFVCPSIYEPFGITNLEAMACGTPVVASAVGGITDVVIPGETGLLIPLEHADERCEDPKDPRQFSRDLAEAVNRLLSSREKLEEMGIKARERVVRHFGWKSAAQQTLEFYHGLTRTG